MKKIGNATLYCADSEDVLPLLKEIDACVTDPPYGLSFMGKRWDYDVPQKQMWEKVFASLKNGSHLLSFFGSRTYHRGAIPIEDAGFEIRDQLMWIYGSGFPKSHNIGKAVDKLQGNERELVETKIKKAGDITGGNFKREGSYPDKQIDITKGTSEYEGWGTALKPAHEPIVMARKPIKGTVAENVLKHGTGGINLDECRVETEDIITNHSRGKESAISKGKYGDSKAQETHQTEGQKLGRFPANVMHDGSDDVQEIFADKALYFYCAKASKKDRDEGLENFEEKVGIHGNKWTDQDYRDGETKPITARKNIHPTVKPTELMRYLCRLVTPKGGVVLDPFMGSGSTGKAAILEGFHFVGIELDEDYFDIAVARIEKTIKDKERELF
tara:strand:+ start:220 stop:1377 length:1158 start_codon:yes stop_codon:yes gene_type:complete